jgi:hypothetical protein
MQTSVAPRSQASLRAGNDGFQRQELRPFLVPALGEAAEPAAHVADVGEVDVPVHRERHGIAHRLPAQLVGHGDDGGQIGATRG